MTQAAPDSNRQQRPPSDDPHAAPAADVTPPPGPVASLPGLGPKSALALGRAGILTIDDLRRVGAVGAYVRVREAGARPSLNLLWALESALTGVDWRVVARTERTRLLMALEDATRRP